MLSGFFHILAQVSSISLFVLDRPAPSQNKSYQNRVEFEDSISDLGVSIFLLCLFRYQAFTRRPQSLHQAQRIFDL
jgi:hypothetical protein